MKDIRQNFSNAITTRTRSESGKIVYGFLDKLVTIWGGSADTKPPHFEVQISDYTNNAGHNDSDYDNKFMQNGDPIVDQNKISD